MKHWIIIIIFIMLAGVAQACQTEADGNNIHITDNIVYDGLGASCNISIFNNNSQIMAGDMTNNGHIYNYTAYNLSAGYYISHIYCNKSGEVFESDCPFSIEGGQMIFAALIIAPLFLGLMFLLGSFFLGEDHNVLKIALFILSPITFWLSLHFALLAVIKFYNFPELQNLIGRTTYITGMVFFILLSYFLIYAFYKMVHIAAQKKDEKLNY